MEPNQAAEHLQTIRTLMERSAVYRRALAPIMIYCGVVGIIGGVIGSRIWGGLLPPFICFWAIAAAVALAGSFLLVRRQALKASEPFWSPPTKRVMQAMIPALSVGAVYGLARACIGGARGIGFELVPVWCILYGLAIHSAGFFMPRGLKLFGWLFMIIGGLIFYWPFPFPFQVFQDMPDLLMGLTFGGLHLAYGIYLYFTEQRGKAS